jgi:hypothetical protein
MSKDLRKSFEESLNQFSTNLTWAEEDLGLWKGWTYSPEKNRYYFDDIGNESLTSFWSDEFLNQAYNERV